MSCVEIVADKVAMLHEGSIVWSDEKKALHHSGNQLVDNFIHGRISGEEIL
jgi:phospholipid/cholesterol/gamma-HCH transport system ATP-binding protein